MEFAGCVESFVMRWPLTDACLESACVPHCEHMMPPWQYHEVTHILYGDVDLMGPTEQVLVVMGLVPQQLEAMDLVAAQIGRLVVGADDQKKGTP